MATPEELAAIREAIGRSRNPLPRAEVGLDLVVRNSDLVWYQPKDNPTRLAPVLGSPMTTFEIFLQEFPPSGTSDMQQHHHEAVHYIISGHGYSEIGPRRYDWSQGDFVFVPPMMWHRHYNASDMEGVTMLLVENSRLLEALGLNYRASVGLKTAKELEQDRNGTEPQK